MALVGTRKPLIGNLVKYEFLIAHGYTREIVTVNTTDATELSIGSVLGKVTADGKYKPRDPDASTGEEVSAAVVVENKSVPASTDTEVAVMVRGPSILADNALVFDVSHDSGQKETAIQEIQTLGIVVRTQV